MTNRAGIKGQGYVRHEVEGNGDCGYTSFGITRENAVSLLVENLPHIFNIIKIPVKHALLPEEFYRYLLDQRIITTSHADQGHLMI